MPKVDVADLRDRAARLAAGFTAGQKTVVALAVLGMVVGGWMFTQWSASANSVPLYSNLSPEDAASITQELAGNGVTYELADGGSTILVPRSDVYQLRIDMSAAGLPSQGAPGYALLEEHGITTSEFRQRVDFQRALEGELSNTIGAIDDVAGATVHLVIPEDDLFSSDESRPSASVLVRERPGATLSGGQVRAIVHLVASSVEGLTPEAVTIADSEGTVLSAPGDGLAAGGDLRAEQTMAFESNLASSIQGMLMPLVGNGHAVVRVKASLDFDSRSTTTERYEGDDAPALTETATSETFTGEGQPPTGGILGPDGATTTAGPGSSYENTATERTFAVGRVTEQVSAAPGSIERLSVAVLLDAEAGAADPAAIESLVTAAAGLDPERGDEIVVEAAAFDTSASAEAADAAETAAAAARSGEMVGLAQTIGAVLLVLVLVGFSWRSARRASTSRVPLELPVGPLGTRSDPLPASLGRETRPLASRQAVPLPAPDRAEGVLGELVERQPDDVAQMLRGWLGDRRAP